MSIGDVTGYGLVVWLKRINIPTQDLDTVYAMILNK